MNKPELLVIDDNEDILDFLRNDLADKYNVITASNGSQALKILSAENISLIVSDIMMPVMDGFEFCRIIKSNIETSHIPIIMLTARDTLKSKINGLELGADAYIEKPFSPEYLHAQISSLLANHTRIKEYYANSPLAHINTMAFTKFDKQFLDTIQNIVNDHIEEQNLDVEHLAQHMNMSRPSLYRKLKAITNMTPNEIINITRLKKAAQLLSQGRYNINSISELVGYSSPTHFGRNFQKQFGLTPSEYKKMISNQEEKK